MNALTEQQVNVEWLKLYDIFEGLALKNIMIWIS